ncbi:MAG: hypothetical protein JWM82_1998, partial [Myxococcales bacterium]|nr:hypothetical protein [Myxococcales bacterium]
MTNETEMKIAARKMSPFRTAAQLGAAAMFLQLAVG